MPIESPPVAAGALVIDDDPMLVALLDRALSQRGLRVWSSLSGEEGVRLYGDHQGEIDLVLLDVCMPGLDGPATLSQLRAINPDVRACLMSGFTSGYSLPELQAMGIDGFYAKPFQVFQLADEVWVMATGARVG